MSLSARLSEGGVTPLQGLFWIAETPEYVGQHNEGVDAADSREHFVQLERVLSDGLFEMFAGREELSQVEKGSPQKKVGFPQGNSRELNVLSLAEHLFRQLTRRLVLHPHKIKVPQS